MSRGIRRGYTIGYIFVIFFVFSFSLFAGNGIKLGVVKFTPGLTLGIGYNSNVYMSNEATAPSDIFFSSNISAGFELPFYTHSFSLGLNIAILKFFTETKQDNTDISPVAQLEMKFAGGLGISVQDSFEYTKEPIFGNYIKASSRTPRYHNVVEPKITYNIPSGIISTSLGFKWQLDHFPTNFTYDLNKYEMNFGVLYKFLPKTSAYVDGGGNYVRRNSGIYNNSTNFKGTFGLRGLITPKLSADIGLGWYYGSFGSAGSANTPIVKLSVNEKFSKLMTLSFAYNRFSQVAITADYFIVNKVALSLWRSLTPVLETSIKGSWWRVDYSSGQQDDNFTTGIQLSFVPAVATWLKSSLGYSFGMRKSNKLNYDYTDHIVKLSIDFSL